MKSGDESITGLFAKISPVLLSRILKRIQKV